MGTWVEPAHVNAQSTRVPGAAVVVGDVCWICVILPSCSTPKIPTQDAHPQHLYLKPSVGEHWVLQAQTQASAQPTDLRV